MLLPAFLAHPGFVVTTVVGTTDAERSKVLSAQHNLEHASGLSELYRTHQPDLVVIATPPTNHAELVIEALSHGSHVLCEKPLAMSMFEAQRMLAAAQQSHRHVFVDFEFRATPGRAALQGRLAAFPETLGRMLSFSWLLGGSGYQAYVGRPVGWTTEATLGGGYLNALGVHLIDYILWAFGDVKALSAIMVTDVAERQDGVNRAEDGFTILFEMAQGASGLLHYRSASRKGTESVLEVVGSEGGYRLEADQRLSGFGTSGALEPVALDGVTPSAKVPAGSAAEVVWIVEQIFQALQGLPHSAPTIEDGVRAQQVLDAVRLSSQLRQWVRV